MTIETLLHDLLARGVDLRQEGDQLRVSGPEALLTPELSATLGQRKEEILDALRHGSTTFPLSHGQWVFWFEQQLAGASATFHVSLAMRIHSSVDADALGRALQLLVNRHPMLRATFEEQGGQLVQRVRQYQTVAFSIVDLTGQTWEAVEAQVKAAHARPFDLAHGPLFRATLFRRTPTDFALICSAHHIVCDGLSLGIILDELPKLYAIACRGEGEPLVPPTAHYADFVAWQTDLLQRKGDELLTFWRQKLAGAPTTLNLQTDFPRPALRTYEGASHPISLAPELTQRLRTLARAENVTLYMLFLAAYQVLLYRYTGQADILVDSTMAGRAKVDFFSVVGNFFAPVIMRTQFVDGFSFRAFLQQVRKTTIESLKHQHYPFSLLVEKLQPARDPARSPLVQVSFGLHQSMAQLEHRMPNSAGLGDRIQTTLGEWQVTLLDSGLLEGMYELDLELIEFPDRVVGSLLCNTSLFDPITVGRMAANFEILLAGILQDPGQLVTELPVLSEVERRQLLVDWNHTGDREQAQECIHHLFEAQAARTPDSVAILFDPDPQATDNPLPLTYGRLNQQANQLAHHLRSLGVGPGSLVGVAVDYSPAMMVGLLAILKAGGAYVPLDPAYPQTRLQQMVDQADITLLLTQRHLQAQLTIQVAQVLVIDAVPAEVSNQSVQNPPPAARPQDLIYAIFTSGSTGMPKGAAIYHGGFANLVQWTLQDLGLNQGDRVMPITSLSFDLTQKNLFAPLLAGGTLYLAPQPYFDPDQLCRQIQRQRISWINCTPSMFYHLAEADLAQGTAALRSLRKVILGGEPIHMARLHSWLAQSGRQVELVNSYGPTECTDVCAAYTIHSQRDGVATNIPIGRPIPGVQLYVLDPRQQLVPMGCAGELWIGGAGVGAGYLQDDALTQARFRPNPFARPGSGQRIYRTGDEVKLLLSGDLLFLGRLDHQVKLRGMRVELGEIEATLVQHPGVKQAVAVLGPAPGGEERLMAYIVPEVESLSTWTPVTMAAVLRPYLESKLPVYMVPAGFMLLDTLPLTPSGKVDRSVLSDVDVDRVPEPIADPQPRTPLQRELAALWAAELGVESVDIHQSFFALGGDSFGAIRLINTLKQQGVSLPLRRIFETPTVAGLAAVLEAESGADSVGLFSQPRSHPEAPPSQTAPQVDPGRQAQVVVQHPGGADDSMATQTLPSHSGDASRSIPPFSSCLIPIQPQGSRPPFFLVHPIMGVVYPYYQLARYLDPEQPTYALQAIGLDSAFRPDRSVPAMAARYVEAMRAVQPQGPYALGGWSFGSWVAFEMAQQLQAAGQAVSLLAIIDTPALEQVSPFWHRWRNNLYLTGVVSRYLMPYVRGFRLAAPAFAQESEAGQLSVWQTLRYALQVFLANHRATLAYAPTPYHGPITLLRTAGQSKSAHAGDLGWGFLSRAGVTVWDVPGNHMTLLQEPHVQALAQTLQAELVRTQPALTAPQEAQPMSARVNKLPAQTLVPDSKRGAAGKAANGHGHPAVQTSHPPPRSRPTPQPSRPTSSRTGPMTGQDYLQSLRDGREVWIYGEQVPDVTAHPAFRNQARMVARLYDALHNPEMKTILAHPTDGAGTGFTHPYFRASYTQQAQQASRDALVAWHRIGFGWMGRGPDHMAGLLGMLGPNADLYAPYDANARRWYLDFQRRMPYVNHALVNPPVDRHRSPDEVNDVFIHVVRETDAGLIVSGAKNITTNAALTNYTFVGHDGGAPVRQREFAATFLLAMNTPGIKIICRPSYEMMASNNPFDYPLSGRFDENDAIMILDEVLVPWENVLIYGDLEKHNKHIHNTGFYPRSGLQSATRVAVKLDLITGLLLHAVEATGVDQFRGVQVNVGEVVTWRHLFWTLSDAMATSAVPHRGAVIPKIEHMMAHRLLMTTVYPRVKELISQLVASGLIFHPSSARDFQTPELRPYLDKYMRGSTSQATDRIKLMKTLWDAMGTEFGGRHELYERNNLGNHEAIRLHALFQGIEGGTQEALMGFATACMDEVDLDGWTAPDLINSASTGPGKWMSAGTDPSLTLVDSDPELTTTSEQGAGENLIPPLETATTKEALQALADLVIEETDVEGGEL